jgi:transcriptional regulator with XRE-family HTH domain
MRGLDKAEVAEAITAWIIFSGTTQTRMAEEAGVSPTTVSHLVNQRIKFPHRRTVQAIAQYFGVSLEAFLAGPHGDLGQEKKRTPHDRLKKLQREGVVRFDLYDDGFGPTDDLSELRDEDLERTAEFVERVGLKPGDFVQMTVVLKAAKSEESRFGRLVATMLQPLGVGA